MDGVKLYEDAAWKLEHGDITLGEFEDMIKPLRDVEKVEHAYWVQVGGYCTPGGDPVWACSNCGKGIHVYGTEAASYNREYADGQWVACPNCGRKMTAEQKLDFADNDTAYGGLMSAT